MNTTNSPELQLFLPRSTYSSIQLSFKQEIYLETCKF